MYLRDQMLTFREDQFTHAKLPLVNTWTNSLARLTVVNLRLINFFLVHDKHTGDALLCLHSRTDGKGTFDEYISLCCSLYD